MNIDKLVTRLSVQNLRKKRKCAKAETKAEAYDYKIVFIVAFIGDSKLFYGVKIYAKALSDSGRNERTSFYTRLILY